MILTNGGQAGSKPDNSKSAAKRNVLWVSLWLISTFAVLAGNSSAQKSKPVVKPKQMIFAVVSDGQLLEPIAYLSSGKLEDPVNGSDDDKLIRAFVRTYYKPGTSYTLIFGGTNAGSATVKRSDAGSECSKNVATVITKTAGKPLRGLIMGLATNAAVKAVKAARRTPTPTERSEIDALAKAEFLREKLTPKLLHYQNLTAVDVDNDGTPEFVGSYWAEVDKQTRALLFLISSKGSDGRYSVGYRDYRTVDMASVMSGQIKDVDDGVYHELLLDSFDYDGDGTNEIFTYTQGFEGAQFKAYHRSGVKWSKAYDWSNYHCGY
jgi:hypothetical protein